MKRLQTDVEEFFGGMAHAPRNNRLDFCGDTDHEPQQGS